MTRRRYLTLGLLLAALKYAGDVALVYLTTAEIWSPLDYLTPLAALSSRKLARAPQWVLPAMAVWTFPFIWIGVKLTAQRAVDAGRSAWVSLWFFVPYANYVLIAALCLTPTASAAPRDLEALPQIPEGRVLPVGTKAIAAGLAIGLVMAVLGMFWHKWYGASILPGTPFVMGTVASFVLNRQFDVTAWETVKLTMAMFGVVAVVLEHIKREVTPPVTR